jgi:uncharacterized protein (TIGR03086 family)
MDATTMQQACESTERFVEQLSPAMYDRPTPCSEWNVHALTNHLLGTLALGQALLTGTPPAVNVGPGEVPDVDLVGDDPLGAYRAGVKLLIDAAGGDALTRTHQTPLGEMPGAVLAGFTTVDILVHGWDLARATGQDATLDPDLAEQVLAFAHQTLADDMRAPRIGPAIDVAAEAPPTDRLVAFFGRTP